MGVICIRLDELVESNGTDTHIHPLPVYKAKNDSGFYIINGCYDHLSSSNFIVL